jgi:ABC-type transport system involved in multi-copper enzyme maturation permease subunit
MNPLVKKEIRLLLPSFGICCALALPNLLFRFDTNGSLQNGGWFFLAFVFCGAMAVMLALNSFGAEISSGTFSNLLAQPISRQKIWDTKILALAVSLSIVGIFFSACGIVRLAIIGHDLNLLDLFTGIVTFGLVVFSGGLWTVLLLRQVAVAFWFTVLVPGMMLVILAGLLAGNSDEFNEGIIAVVLGAYSLAGFFFARWLFFRAQDWQWTGGTLVMPEMRGLTRLKSFAFPHRARTPRAALWRKEIQLHQAQFVIAFILLVLHLGAIVTRHLGHFRKNSTTEFILEGFWVLWLVMPLLVGCAAVAEERKLGTHESQLCLPVKRRTQFAIKLLVAFGLSLALGALMPLLLEGTKILPDTHLKGIFAPDWWNQTSSTVQIFIGNCLGTLSGLMPLLTLAGVTVLISGISFYVSTLARNTLQTLAPAVAGIALMCFLLSTATIPEPFEYKLGFLWHGPLPYYIALPMVALTLLALAYSNYQHVLTGWKLVRRNLLTLVSVFVAGVVATSAVYHRAWEKLTPFEPPHGAARLTLANQATLSTEGGGASVRLPDGKIWTAGVLFDPKMNRLAWMLGNIKMILNDGQFIGGSNWLTAKRTWWDLVGIKTDGTLWASEKSRQVTRQQGQWKISGDEMRHLVQFGTDTNWSSLAPWAYSVLLTKTDGTLWRWGTIEVRYDVRTNRWPGLRTFTPERLGTESNWAEVFHSGYRTCFRKTDGSLWTETYAWETNGQLYLEIEPGYLVARIFDGETSGKYRSTALIYHDLDYRVGIRDDGTFRIWAHQLLTTNSQQRYAFYEWSATDLQIGNGTNWLAVDGAGDKVVTLKDDGTLWLWNFHRNYYNPARDGNRYEQEVLKTVPVRLGTHSDWIAISGNGGPVTTLAADGSLWFWPLGDEFYWGETGNVFGYRVGTGYMLLDISRKPQLLGKIFQGTN